MSRFASVILLAVLALSFYMAAASDNGQALTLTCHDEAGLKLQPLYSASDAISYEIRQDEGATVLVLRARYNASMLPLAQLPPGTGDSLAARQEQLIANFIQVILRETFLFEDMDTEVTSIAGREVILHSGFMGTIPTATALYVKPRDEDFDMAFSVLPQLLAPDERIRSFVRGVERCEL